MNARAIPATLTDERVLWMAVGKAWQDESPACDSCDFCESKSQAVPYQEGTATQEWRECGLDFPRSPLLCPALRLQLEEQEEA